MAGQVWSVSADGGYLFHDQLSKELTYRAQPLMRWRQFVDREEQFGQSMGRVLLFNKVLDVDTSGGVIAEGAAFPRTKGKIVQDSITALRYGNSIDFTEDWEIFSEVDINQPLQKWLMNDMAKTLNTMAYDAFNNGKITYSLTGIQSAPTATWGTAGTFSADNRVPGFWDVKNIIDAMKKGVYGSNSASPVPPYDEDGNYICICSVDFARRIKDDHLTLAGANNGTWIDAGRYGDPERLFSGEIGRLYGCRFIEDNHKLTGSMDPAANSGNGTITSGTHAIFFGADAVREIVVTPEEVRRGLPEEFGTQRRVAWTYVGGCTNTWKYNSSTEPDNRIVRLGAA